MLIIDNRKEIPLDVSRLDWNPDRLLYPIGEEKIIIPLNDPALNETAEEFARRIAAQYPWAWPDLERTAVAFEVDMSGIYTRFALWIKTKPSTEGGEDTDEWTEFDKQRRQAAEADADKTFGDVFPVMLTIEEEQAVQRELCDRFDLY